MCKGIRIVWLGCEKQPKLAQKWPKTVIFRFFFDFLKNCPYDSNEIFYSHSTPYYGPLCAISLNSYGWNVGNIAKFSPKMAKKTVIFRFFDFLTNCSYDSNESESEGKRLRPTPLPHMRLWFFFSRPFHENFKFLKHSPYDFYKILRGHSTLKGAPACSTASKSYAWDVRNIAKISPKMTKNSHFSIFFDFCKNSIRFEQNFLQSFSTP